MIIMKREYLYGMLLREEISNIKPQATGITGGQLSAAKARATKKFLKLTKR